MNILVIDGQGGMIGRQLITEIRRTMSDVEITAVGTNTLATASMLKAAQTAALPARMRSSSARAVRMSSSVRSVLSLRIPCSAR